jgi:hypothetical protein
MALSEQTRRCIILSAIGTSADIDGVGKAENTFIGSIGTYSPHLRPNCLKRFSCSTSSSPTADSNNPLMTIKDGIGVMWTGGGKHILCFKQTTSMNVRYWANSGQNWIFARNSLSAYDPKRISAGVDQRPLSNGKRPLAKELCRAYWRKSYSCHRDPSDNRKS